MKQIITYKNVEEALEALDNGGRFYKVETQANDGIIDQSELENLGGPFQDKKQMILFLGMSIIRLTEVEKETLFSKLDTDLVKAYEKYKPLSLSPQQAKFKGRLASNVIITGTPKLIASDFKGSTMFPVSTGNSSILMMTPMVEEYEVYNIKDENSPKTYKVAHLNHFDKIYEEKMILGGVIKEFVINEGEYETKGKFLDITYCSKF
jgi:hypothetical protein